MFNCIIQSRIPQFTVENTQGPLLYFFTVKTTANSYKYDVENFRYKERNVSENLKQRNNEKCIFFQTILLICRKRKIEN